MSETKKTKKIMKMKFRLKLFLMVILLLFMAMLIIGTINTIITYRNFDEQSEKSLKRAVGNAHLLVETAVMSAVENYLTNSKSTKIGFVVK